MVSRDEGLFSLWAAKVGEIDRNRDGDGGGGGMGERERENMNNRERMNANKWQLPNSGPGEILLLVIK